MIRRPATRRVEHARLSLPARPGIDRRNAAALVDDLQSRRLARRRPHPTDRRAKLVDATRKGKQLAANADKVLGTPRPSLAAIGDADQAELQRILDRASDR